jgi:membrane protein YqaA with SNARE-associated domain
MAGSYLLLFFWSFLSATILPIGVEPYYAWQVSASDDLLFPLLIASVGNTLGGITLLYMGMMGSPWIYKQLHSQKKEKIESLSQWVQKYGHPLLLLSWIPVIGDILVMIVGMSKPKMGISIMYLSIGKTLRFFFVGWLVIYSLQ